MFVKPTKARSAPKNTTVRLTEKQQSIVAMPKTERSEWVSGAIEQFLDWETYTATDWTKADVGDGQTWLDAVEMGVEYKVRSKLLPPTQISLSPKAAEALEAAAKIVEQHRPALRDRGIVSGLIRTAITHRQFSGD